MQKNELHPRSCSNYLHQNREERETCLPLPYDSKNWSFPQSSIKPDTSLYSDQNICSKMDCAQIPA
jgi:hypothetical protein